MASPAKAPQASIYIKVVAGNDLRNHLSKPPMPSMLLRISVAGQAQPEVYKTTPVPAGNSPKWNQEFILPIPDPTKSQLECTLWDESDPSPQKYSNFLGEVLLNVAKLAPYKGTYIEQSFQVRQGKTIQTENQASGSLKLGLRLDLPLEAGAVPAPAPVPHVARDVEGEKKQEEEEALKVKAEAERKAAELKAKEEELLKKEEEAKTLQVIAESPPDRERVVDGDEHKHSPFVPCDAVYCAAMRIDALHALFHLRAHSACFRWAG